MHKVIVPNLYIITTATNSILNTDLVMLYTKGTIAKAPDVVKGAGSRRLTEELSVLFKLYGK